MKTTLIVPLLVTAFAVPAFAGDNGMRGRDQERGSGQQIDIEKDVSQKKSEILAHIDERIANSQAERSCVQSAQSHSEMQSCRERFRPQRMENNQQNRKERPM